MDSRRIDAVSKDMLDLRGIIIVASVSVLAVGLSIMSYRSAVLTSDEIVKIAASDVKENAETQAYDLSRIISSKVRSINENLQILANGPEVQKGDFQSPLPLFTA